MKNLKTFLKEDLKVRHKGGRSNKLLITINGHDYICNNQEEVSDKIKTNLNLFKNNINYTKYTSAIKQEITDPEEYYNKVYADISTALKEILTEKTEILSKINDIAGAPSDIKFLTLNAEPNVNLNNIDYEILKGIKYCAADKSIYFKRNKTLRLIGSIEAVEKKPVINGLCAEITKNIEREFHENTKYSLKEFITDITNALAENKKYLMNEIQKSIDAGIKWNDISIELTKNEVFKPKDYASEDKKDAIDSAAESYLLQMYWYKVPASMFSTKIISIKNKIEEYEFIDSDGHKGTKNIWRGYYVGTNRIDDIISEERYLKNFFTHFKAELMDNDFFKIDDMPRTYTDIDNIDSLFKYDEERLRANLPKDYYRKFSECENLELLKSWMNEGEYRLAMAWAYAVLHPNTINSNIGLLLWTGGGTGKSSFVAIIKEALMMASDAKATDIYFEIKGNDFDEDKKFWVPDGQAGVPYAALINVDEATTKTIELYKDFSGSASGNKLSFRRLYEDSSLVDIHGKFIFTTNKGLQLSSDDGSLMRRVAIIKHKEIKNVIGRANKSSEEIQLEFKKQVPMLISEGEKAVKEIKNLGYDSIDKYASEYESIAKNLKESTASTVNEMLYLESYNKIVQLYSDLGIPYEDCVRIQAGTLKFIYKIVAEEQGEEAKYFSSFKNWIMENSSNFIHPNIRKPMRNFIRLKNGNMATSMMVGNFEFYENHSNCIFELYPLNKKNMNNNITEEDIEVPEESAEKVVDEDITSKKIKIDPHFPQALECDTLFEEYNPITVNEL